MRHNRKSSWSMSFLLVCAFLALPSCSSDISQAVDTGPPVASISVAVDSATLLVGHIAHASATVKDSAGNLINGSTINWSSLTPKIASVSPSGNVTAVASGSAVIEGKIGGASGMAPVTVVIPPDLASHDFNDGTFGLYTNPFPLDIDVVADPTGAGKGKVARLHYVRATSDGSVFDVNREFQFTYPRRYGDPLYFRGDFYIQAADLGDGFVQRKLIYWQSHEDYTKYPLGYGGPNFRTVVVMYGNQLAVDATFNPAVGNGTSDTHRTHVERLATIVPSTWYTLEVFQQLESSIGGADGILRVWLNGTMVFEKTTMQWTDPGWVGATGDYTGSWSNPGAGQGVVMDAADIYSQRFYIGDQFNWSGVWNEYRYWDNVAFSTQRIGK
jgi:Bacterial Ig-like domain (group 2)